MYVVVMVNVIHQINACATMVGLVQFVKLQDALAFYPTTQLLVTQLTEVVNACNQTNVVVMQDGLALLVIFHVVMGY